MKTELPLVPTPRRPWPPPLVFALLLLLTSVTASRGAESAGVASAVERAVASEDWKAVASVLASTGPESTVPVLRLLKAHASLALNRNDESLCLFLGAASEPDRSAWLDWTGEFLKRHPRNAAAGYLRGDALARARRRAEALAVFTSALKESPRDSLLLNARGVTLAASGRLDEAGDDFAAAARATPHLADVHASAGTRLLQKKSGAQGALEHFERATRESSHFSLAQCGRGCSLFALGRFEEAFQDVTRARTNCDCAAGVLLDCLVAMDKSLTSPPDPQLAGLPPEQVGTLLDRRYSDLRFNASQATYNRFVSDLRGMPLDTQNHYLDRLHNDARRDPFWGNRVDTLAQRSMSWNRSGGIADTFSSLAGASFGIRGERAGFDLSLGDRFAANRVQMTRDNFDLSRRVNASLGSSAANYNGVTTRPVNARLIEPDAFIPPRYGLCYE